MSQEFVKVLRAYHAPEPLTKESYLLTAWAGLPPEETIELDDDFTPDDASDNEG
jgi:hypothetical protein